jgi:integrase
MKMKLTMTAILNQPLPKKGRLTIHDTATPGLCVRITESGARTFYLCRWQSNGRGAGTVKWVRLGDVGEMTVEKAQRAARDKNSDLAAGIDPNAVKRAQREAATLGAMWTAYLDSPAMAEKRERTKEEDAGLWRRYLEPWTAKRLAEVTEETVQSLYQKIRTGKMGREMADSKGRMRPVKGGLTAANRTMAVLSGMFTQCAKMFGMAGYNPAREVRKVKEEACETYLTAEQMPAFWTAMGKQSEMLQDLVKLALFTMQRRSTLLTMRWDEVQLPFKTWTIPAAKMKGKKSHGVPLSPQAMEILERRRAADPEGEWVFATDSASGHLEEPKKALAAICKAAGIQPVTLHDLRRTAATWAVSNGAGYSDVRAMLAHSKKDTTGIYVMATADGMRKAAEIAGAAIMAAVGTQAVEAKAG